MSYRKNLNFRVSWTTEDGLECEAYLLTRNESQSLKDSLWDACLTGNIEKLDENGDWCPLLPPVSPEDLEKD